MSDLGLRLKAFWAAVAEHIKKNSLLPTISDHCGVYIPRVGAELTGTYVYVKGDEESVGYWATVQEGELVSRIIESGRFEMVWYLSPVTEPQAWMEGKPDSMTLNEGIRIAEIPNGCSVRTEQNRTFYNYQGTFHEVFTGFVNQAGDWVQTQSCSRDALLYCLEQSFLPETVEFLGTVQQRNLSHRVYLFTAADGATKNVTVWRDGRGCEFTS